MRKFTQDQIMEKSRELADKFIFANITVFVELSIAVSIDHGESYQNCPIPVTYDDMYEADLELADLQEQLEQAQLDNDYEKIDDLNHRINYHEIEPYNWFLVDRAFAQDLIKHNEMVVELYDKTIWGRKTFGQAVYIDDVFMQIATEYLEQEY